MSSGFRLHHVVPLIPAILLIACSTSSISRIDSNRDVYESWPVEVQEAILGQRAVPGMTAEQVEMALGQPTEIISRSSRGGGVDEVWIYRKGNKTASMLANTALSVGTGVGGIDVGSVVGGGQSGSPDEVEVVFREGVVARSGK